MFVLPLLVAVLGLVLLALGQAALRDSSRDLGRTQFVAQSRSVASSIDHALAQADPLRERMVEIASAWRVADDPTKHAYELSDLILGRPGVAYASVSFPNGTFAGVFLEDDGRACRFQVSEVEGPERTRVRVWDPTRRDGLVFVRDERSDYDPRARDFYKLALRTPGPVWTEPYPFFKTNVTGITLTQAVYERDRPSELHAVITVDFDIEALSAAMSDLEIPDGAVLVLATQSGTILAAPGFRERFPSLAYPKDRPLAVSDLDDPVVKALVGDAGPASDEVFGFEIGGTRYLAARERVGRPQGLLWFTSMSVDEERFFSRLPSLRRRALLVSGLAVVLATLLSLLVARLLARARSAVVAARREAEEALGQAKELGSYRLVERLAHGGMGEVWRAEHRLLARPAAIKLIRSDVPDAMGRSVAEERFRREAETLAGLRSRSTVQIFDYGLSEDGTFYLVMELLDGVDLDRLVARDGPQPAARVIAILDQALGSLAEAHDIGLVHRDVKPGNLFLSRAADELDIVKVLDFGVVRSLAPDPAPPPPSSDVRARGAESSSAAPLTSKEGYLGTPGYMAPEQIRHQPVDPRTDLYSLGCVAYFLLTGQTVFGPGSSMSTLVAHMTKAPPSPKALAKGFFPDELAALVLACLAKDPSQRPESARALRARLRAIPVPEEHAWTRERAQAWWASFTVEARAPAGEEARLVVAKG